VRKMDESTINLLKKPRLKKPVLIEGLPGMGYVGKLAAEHLVEELGAKKFAEMRSPHFPHHVQIEPDGIIRLAKNEFYHAHADGKDVVVLVGDAQATSPEGHYETTNKILDLAEQLKVSQIFTLGGYATGRYSKRKPQVIGVASHEELMSIFRERGVKIEEGTGPIIGASGLLLELGKLRKMKGTCLLGETHGMLVDHRAAQSVLETLTDILGIKVDMNKLEQRAKKTEKLIGRIQKDQKLRKRKRKRAEEEEVSYIG
jgi:uncharacterized protein (TIGR00162 family)